MGEFSASVLFCDDVRHEQGGKISAIGIYRGFLGANDQIPVLAKIVALVMLEYPTAATGKPARLRLLDRETVLADFPFDLLPPAALPKKALDAGLGESVLSSIPIEFIGFPVVDGARLRVEVEMGSFAYVSDELLIFNVPPTDAPAKH